MSSSPSEVPLHCPAHSLAQGRCSENEPEWEGRLLQRQGCLRSSPPPSPGGFGEFPDLLGPGFHPARFCSLIFLGVALSPAPQGPDLLPPLPQHLGRAGRGWIGRAPSSRAVPGNSFPVPCCHHPGSGSPLLGGRPGWTSVPSRTSHHRDPSNGQYGRVSPGDWRAVGEEHGFHQPVTASLGYLSVGTPPARVASAHTYRVCWHVCISQ